MTRLEKMVEILSSFAPKESVQLFSYDLNLIIREKLNEYKKTAKKAGVKLEAKLDENGCPSEVNIEKIGRVMDQILKNALEKCPGSYRRRKDDSNPVSPQRQLLYIGNRR
jgi:nitrogen fixation/metabolism regulation signal transduction histidine kinase